MIGAIDPRVEVKYRMSYEGRRHIIGYEMRKILVVIDWFEKEDEKNPATLIQS